MYRKYNQPQSIKSSECPECHSKRLLFTKGKIICSDCQHVIGKTYNKYGNKKQTFNGRNYDSGLEANYAQHFDTLLKAKEIKEVQPQVSIPLQAYGKHITNYIIDFIIIHNDGHKEYCEIKGMETSTWKLKLKMLEAKVELEEPSSEITVYYQGKTKKVR
jgi:hypothetical protein